MPCAFQLDSSIIKVKNFDTWSFNLIASEVGMFTSTGRDGSVKSVIVPQVEFSNELDFVIIEEFPFFSLGMKEDIILSMAVFFKGCLLLADLVVISDTDEN